MDIEANKAQLRIVNKLKIHAIYKNGHNFVIS